MYRQGELPEMVHTGLNFADGSIRIPRALTDPGSIPFLGGFLQILDVDLLGLHGRIAFMALVGFEAENRLAAGLRPGWGRVHAKGRKGDGLKRDV